MIDELFLVIHGADTQREKPLFVRFKETHFKHHLDAAEQEAFRYSFLFVHHPERDVRGTPRQRSSRALRTPREHVRSWMR